MFGFEPGQQNQVVSNQTYGSNSIAQNNGTANYINVSGDASMRQAVNALPDMATNPGVSAAVGQVAHQLITAAEGAMLAESMNPNILGLFAGLY